MGKVVQEKYTNHVDNLAEGDLQFKCPHCGWIFCENCSPSYTVGEHSHLICPNCNASEGMPKLWQP